MWSFFSKDPSKDLNYELLECVSNGILDDKSIWSIHNGRKKGSPNDLVTVFAFQAKPGNESVLNVAKNGYKRMKIVRHPNVLTFIDGLETDKAVFVVTERVQPLITYLNESKDNESQKENEISWGLHQIATALNFLNNDCKIVHNNISIASIYVNKAGEWKLSGLEFVHGINDEPVANRISILGTLTKYEPPERQASSASKIQQDLLWTLDSWGFGCLVWEIFNGPLSSTNALKNFGKMPKRLIPVYTELVNGTPRNRLTPTKFLDICRNRNGFMDNHFVNTLVFLEQIQIKDQAEKTKFFTELTDKLDDFPRSLALFLILPQLLNSYEFGNAGSSILAPLFKLGKLLDETEYQKKIIPIVVKLFSSTDRTTRMRLLQQLHLFIEHLSPGCINDQLFPHICQGFTDSSPAIREHTIRAMVLLAPKLNYNNLNIELMKHFARLQGQDDQGMIRTNTTVCIGKIAPYINPQLRQRILLSAFPKAMRDPFPPARLSGVIALANTDRFYTLRDVASKVMPCLCLACIDPDKDVRDEVFKTIKMFMAKFEKVSENPDLAIEMEKDINACNLDVKNETSWTSWAMTSLSAKLTDYKNKNKQQASVALSSTGESKKAIENSSTNKQSEKPSAAVTVETKPKESTTTTSTLKPQQSFTSPFDSSFDSKPTNQGDGWDDGNQWQDFDEDNDDDDKMEPLEPFNAPTTFSSNKTSTSKLPTTTPTVNKGGWDLNNWSNLDDDNESVKSSKSNSSNWNAQPTVQDEEELFSNLVKDVSLKKTSATKPKNDWGNDDWNTTNFETVSTVDQRKQERDERNSKLKEQNAAKKQSKPLKLGAKRDE